MGVHLYWSPGDVGTPACKKRKGIPKHTHCRILALSHIQPDVKRPNLEYNIFCQQCLACAMPTHRLHDPGFHDVWANISHTLIPSFVEQIYEDITGLYTAVTGEGALLAISHIIHAKLCQPTFLYRSDLPSQVT